jgi:hypothetical protein
LKQLVRQRKDRMPMGADELRRHHPRALHDFRRVVNIAPSNEQRQALSVGTVRAATVLICEAQNRG